MIFILFPEYHTFKIFSFLQKSVDKMSKLCYNVTVDKMSESFRPKPKTNCR